MSIIGIDGGNDIVIAPIVADTANSCFDRIKNDVSPFDLCIDLCVRTSPPFVFRYAWKFIHR